jgi:hypothetical protein
MAARVKFQAVESLIVMQWVNCFLGDTEIPFLSIYIFEN